MIELKITLVLEAGSSLVALAAAAEGAKGGSSGSAGNVPLPSAPTAELPPPPPPVDGPAPVGDVKVDAAGVPFDPARHTGTQVKSGLWRMKVGVSRPAHEGLPEGGAPTPVAELPPPPPLAAPTAGEDEFAQFRAAAEVAPPPPPVDPAAPREYTDADLSKLCNDAAMADGKPDRVAALINQYVTAPDATKHSRNIHPTHRAQFVQAVEQTCGIKFAG